MHVTSITKKNFPWASNIEAKRRFRPSFGGVTRIARRAHMLHLINIDLGR